MTVTETAEACGYSYSTVWRLENGSIGPTRENVERLAEAFRLQEGEKAELEAFGGLRGTAGNGMIAQWQQAISARAHSMSVYRAFGLTCVSGYLQTEDYMREVFGSFMKDADEIDSATTFRLERQKRLFDEDKRFLFVLSEAALRTRITSPQAHLCQLSHLRSLMPLPNIEIRVLPLSTRLVLIPMNGFCLIDGSEVEVETLTKVIRVTEAEPIDFYLSVFSELRASALAGRDAAIFLEEMILEVNRGLNESEEEVLPEGWDPTERYGILEQTYSEVLPKTR